MVESISLEVNLRAFVRRESAARWIAACPQIGVVSQGRTSREAKKSLQDPTAKKQVGPRSLAGNRTMVAAEQDSSNGDPSAAGVTASGPSAEKDATEQDKSGTGNETASVGVKTASESEVSKQDTDKDKGAVHKKVSQKKPTKKVSAATAKSQDTGKAGASSGTGSDDGSGGGSEKN